MKLQDQKREICDIGRLLHQHGFLAAADGNISMRVDENRTLITASGRHKAFLDENLIAMVDSIGHCIAGFPSSETPMHVAIYQHANQAKAIIHAHPPHCIAWTISHPNARELPLEVMPEVLLGLGKAPIVPYQTPGSNNLAQLIASHAVQHRVLIMARHGVVSWGENMMEAYMGIERIEHAAKVLTIAQSMGGMTPLPSSEVAKLRQLREHLGPQSR